MGSSLDYLNSALRYNGNEVLKMTVEDRLPVQFKEHTIAFCPQNDTDNLCLDVWKNGKCIELEIDVANGNVIS